MTSKFERELISVANHLSNDKVKVIAVYTEIWKGLSVNSHNVFEQFLVDDPKLEPLFNDDKKQIGLVPVHNLKFPIRVENIKCLDAIVHFVRDFVLESQNSN